MPVAPGVCAGRRSRRRSTSGPSFAAYPLLSAREKAAALRALAALGALRPDAAAAALDEITFADWLGRATARARARSPASGT